MSEPFFHPLGDEITISDKDKLVKIILEIDFEIGASKTSNFRERFTLGQYLLTLASLSQLEYPFSIEKHETPDFVWRRKGVEIEKHETPDFVWRRKGVEIGIEDESALP